MHNNKGVTLTEMVIVVAIIGILAAIAIPSYLGQQKRAARNEAYANLENLRLLEEQYYAENSCYYREGNPLVCTDKNINGVASIQVSTFLPRFQPGSDLNFNYAVSTYTSNGVTAGCFRATATGVGSRVNGDSFWIDCNNNKTF